MEVKTTLRKGKNPPLVKKAKKKQAKAEKKCVKAPVKEVTTVRAVSSQGTVYLHNGIKAHCGVGRNGPVVSTDDVYVKQGNTWVPEK